MKKLEEALIGQKLFGIWVSPGEECLYLKTEAGRIYALATEGDCCSETWWADLIGVRDIFCRAKWEDSLVVTDVISMALEEPVDARTRQEYDQAYGIEIKFGYHSLRMIYRNSSNGYYGGWCSVEEVTVIPEDCERVYEDWSA